MALLVGGQTAAEDRRSSAEPAAPPATRGLSDRALWLITAASLLPTLWMGYGTDIDVANVLRAGGVIRDLGYQPSRNPGAPVYETIAAVLEPLGGHLAINLATAVAAGAVVVGIARLVRAWDHANGDLVALAFLASPVTLIAAASTGDFVWAMAFFVWGALAHLRGRAPAAAVLFALAVGSRSSTLVAIAAFLIADGWSPAHRRRSVVTSTTMLPLALVLWVPAWLASDRTFAFLTHVDDYNGFANNVGRLLYKNYAAWGVAAVVAVVTAVPALLRALRRWGDDPLLRFAVMQAAGVEAVFFLMPWKAAHLLPALMALLLWIAASELNGRRYLWLLIGAIALHGIVLVRPLAPDTPDAGRTAHVDLAVGWGLLVNDVRCRLDYMDVPPTPTSGAYDCSLEPVRGPGDPDRAADPGSGAGGL